MSVFDDEVLTIDDLAAYLKLRRQTLYRWAQKGKIPGAKIGKEWRFRRSVVEDWILKTFGSVPPSELLGDKLPGENGTSTRHDREPRKPAAPKRRRGGPEKS